MPPLRFLHAAGLAPDASLPAPSPGLADLLVSAPLAAVRRLVTRAIELDADFLLVTPAASADDLSPSAESTLRSEFDRLLEQGVTVFLATGSSSPGWDRLAGRGSNVVLLTPGSFAPVADRDGRPVGILRCVDHPTTADHATSPGPDDSLDLAVAPNLAAADLDGVSAIKHDYLGLGEGPRRFCDLTGGFAYAPGSLQATGPQETGPHGATLVTIEPTGEVRTEFVPAAAVRFESFAVSAEPNDVIEDLALRMTEHLDALRPEPGETAWLVRWTVEAETSLEDALRTPSGRSDLLGLLSDKVGDVTITHMLTEPVREVAMPAPEPAPRPQPQPLRVASDDTFASRFATALREHEPNLADAGRRLALVGVPADAPNRDRLARLLASVDAAAVLDGARRHGLLVTAAADGSDED